MGFNLLKIKNDIKWHLDMIKDEYSHTFEYIGVKEISSDKITLECVPNTELSDVEKSGMEDTLLDDYYCFLSKHHPEVKKEQIILETTI